MIEERPNKKNSESLEFTYRVNLLRLWCEKYITHSEREERKKRTHLCNFIVTHDCGMVPSLSKLSQNFKIRGAQNLQIIVLSKVVCRNKTILVEKNNVWHLTLSI